MGLTNGIIWRRDYLFFQPIEERESFEDLFKMIAFIFTILNNTLFLTFTIQQ